MPIRSVTGFANWTANIPFTEKTTRNKTV